MRVRFPAVLITAILLATSCTSATSTAAGAGAADSGMSRRAAMAQLMEESFLPQDEASCVVDQVFLEVGTYNLKAPEAVNVDSAKIIGDCTFDRDFEVPDPVERDPDEPEIEIEELEIETTEIRRIPPFELTADSHPAIAPGDVATGQVELGGKTIDYVTVTPQGFTEGRSAPVFLAFPPGGQDLEITENVVLGVYAQQAIARGWVVVSPASPGGRWFDDDNTAVIPEMISWINAWVTMEGGRPHLGGMSNGGISAFHIAAQDPEAFQSVLGFPGFPNSEEDQLALLELADTPVRLWVGGEDTNWVTSSQTTVETLRAIGGDAELTVFPGEPHVIQSLTGGVPIFNALDSLRG